MAGVSDAAFRSACLGMGAALVYTEMVSAMALCYKDKKTGRLLYVPEGDRPVGAQIFGHEPSVMAEGACYALEISGADLIDINMGCPVGKIVKSGDGSALMQNPDLAFDIISAVRKAVSVPVTVKFRKGWDNGSINAVSFAQMCEQAGADAVAVHGRTKKAMYGGRADWDIIRELTAAVKIPVIANGDVFDGADATHILSYTNADFCMIGRGAMGDPWIFSRANAAIAGSEIPPLPSLRERLETAVIILKKAAVYKGERLACIEARGHLPRYLRGAQHASSIRARFTGVSTIEEVNKIIEEFADYLK